MISTATILFVLAASPAIQALPIGRLPARSPQDLSDPHACLATNSDGLCVAHADDQPLTTALPLSPAETECGSDPKFACAKREVVEARQAPTETISDPIDPLITALPLTPEERECGVHPNPRIACAKREIVEARQPTPTDPLEPVFTGLPLSPEEQECGTDPKSLLACAKREVVEARQPVVTAPLDPDEPTDEPLSPIEAECGVHPDPLVACAKREIVEARQPTPVEARVAPSEPTTGPHACTGFDTTTGECVSHIDDKGPDGKTIGEEPINPIPAIERRSIADLD